MRILALQLKRIGDAVLTAPALAVVRAAVPGAGVHLVLHGPAGALGPAFPGLASVTTWRAGSANLGVLGWVARGGWDAVLDFTGNDRSFLLAALSRARRRFAYARHAAGPWRRRVATDPVDASVRDLSTVDFHLALARAAATALGVPTPTDPPPPYLDVAAARRPDGLPARYAVIHPGTARDEKYWTTDGWVEVVGALQKSFGLPVVLTGSDDAREQAHLEPLRVAMGGALVDLAGKLDLLVTAAVLGGAALVVTVDSAAMHLAAQFGVPQVAMFGPTNPFHWAPRHARARTLLAGRGLVAPDEVGPRHAAAPMEAIGAGDVLAAACGAMEMRPSP